MTGRDPATDRRGPDPAAAPGPGRRRDVLLPERGLLRQPGPRLPEVKADLGLSNSSSARRWRRCPRRPAGRPVVGGAHPPVRPARLASYGLVLLGLTLWSVAVAPNWPALAAALLVAGALDAVIDVAQNAHGLRVQRLYGGRSSTASTASGASAPVSGGPRSAAAGLAVPLVVHLGVSAVVFGGRLLAFRAMLPVPTTPSGTPRTKRTGTAPPPSSTPDGAPPSWRWRRWASSRPAVPSSRTPAPRGARCTCATSWRPARRRPGSGSSRCRAP